MQRAHRKAEDEGEGERCLTTNVKLTEIHFFVFYAFSAVKF
jgi:hypothetical protein